MLIILIFFWGVAATAAPLTLKEAVLRAVQNSPDLTTDRASVEIRSLERRNASARLLPSLDLTSTHGIQKSTPGLLTDPWLSSTNLSLTENLYDNGQTLTQRRLTAVNEAASQIALEQSRDRLALKVSQEFYQLSLARELVVLKEKQLELIRKQFEAVNAQYKQGMRTRKDFLCLSTQVKRGEIELRNAENSAQQSVIELRRLLGQDPNAEAAEELEFGSVAAKEPIQTIPAIAPAVDKTFDVRLQEEKRKAAPLDVSLAERRLWPQVFVKSEAFYQNGNYLGSGQPFNATQYYGWNATLQLSFNFLDWGIRSRDVAIAESNRIIQDAAYRRARQQANADIKRLQIDLKQQKRNYDLARELRAAEEETYNVIRLEYQEGKVAYLDLITSLKDFLEATTQYLNAHFGLMEAIARHHYLEGNLYETVVQ